jgi:hypothetical protein
VREYLYDATGHLETVSNATELLYRFKYQALLNERGYDPYLMTQIEDGTGGVLLQNEFEDHSRVSAQKLADGQIVRYEYLYNRPRDIIETRVTMPDGSQQRVFFKEGKPTGKM